MHTVYYNNTIVALFSSTCLFSLGYLPVGEIITGCNCRCSPAGGIMIARASTVPKEVPTYRHGVMVQSPLRA